MTLSLIEKAQIAKATRDAKTQTLLDIQNKKMESSKKLRDELLKELKSTFPTVEPLEHLRCCGTYPHYGLKILRENKSQRIDSVLELYPEINQGERVFFVFCTTPHKNRIYGEIMTEDELASKVLIDFI